MHKDGHYVVMLVGLMVMVHVLASLRRPDILLAQISPGLEDYCVDCPTRRFWLNFGSCANDDIAVNASAPLPPYPPPMPPYPPPGQVAVIDSDDVASAISEQEAAAAVPVSVSSLVFGCLVGTPRCHPSSHKPIV